MFNTRCICWLKKRNFKVIKMHGTAIKISSYRHVALWSELLATNHDVLCSIPGSTMGIFLVGGGNPW